MPSRALTCLLLAALALGDAAAEDWPQFHGDARRSGRPSGPALPATAVVAWAVALDPESVDASPAIAAGCVYVGTAGGKIVCVKAADGTTVWEFATAGAVLSSPAVAGGLVFAGSADRCLYALDAASGKLRWRLRTRRPVVAPPLVRDGRVYCGSMDGTFSCVDAVTGARVWESREAGEISAGAASGEAAPPAADAAADLVYYGDEAGNVLARSAADGKLAWSAHLAGGIVAAPLVAGDRLIVPVMSATALSPPPTPCLTVLDRKSGAQLWALTRASSVLHTPVADDEFVYFATVSGYLSDTELFAYRLADGTEVWKRRLGGVADSSPLLSGTNLLFGNHDGNFYFVDKASGANVALLPLGAKVYSSPAQSDGAVYFGAQDGKLYCVR